MGLDRMYEWVAASTISPKMSPEDLQKAEFLLGPLLIGSFADVLFQGILFCQYAHYFEMYRDDKLYLKLAVMGLLIITTLKSVQSIASVWIQHILYFNDLDGSILLEYTAWWQSGSALMVATIGLYVQVFFLHRLYAVSGRKWWVIAPIAVLFAFSFCAICLATYYITLGVADGFNIAVWFAAHLSTVFAGDLSVTLSIAYFLIRSKRDVLPRTVDIIDSLVRLTFSTAAPAAMCAMCNLIFSQLYSNDSNLISSGFNEMLPKLYAFSMMWTLNARRSLRAVAFTYTSEGTGPRNNNLEFHTTQLTEFRIRSPTIKSMPGEDQSGHDPMCKEDVV